MEFPVPRFLKRRGHLFLLIPMVAAMALPLCAISDLTLLNRTDSVFGLAHELVVSGGGLFFFFFGFAQLRKKRLVENTPTSKIRSVAMGINEVTGFARERAPLKSPLSGASCVFYKFKMEKEVRRSKGGTYWQTVNEGCSANYFYIEDGTGKLLVDPLYAETMLLEDYENISGATGIFSGNRMRYTEWYIAPGDYVYILGTVRKFKDMVQDRKDRLIEKLRKLKEDRERLLKEFDADKDGQISAEEWDRARSAMEQELLEEEQKNPPAIEDDIVIAKGDAEKTFILSDRDETDVTHKLGWWSFGSTALGFLLVIVMAVSILARCGFMPDYCIIPWRAFYR
jgi:hypothetical protein